MSRGTFTCTVRLGNAAMQDGVDVAEALEPVVRRLALGGERGAILDLNGNTVGNWALEVTPDQDEEADRG